MFYLDHFYTTNASEVEIVMKLGYKYEQIECWIWPDTANGTVANISGRIGNPRPWHMTYDICIPKYLYKFVLQL